MSSPEPIFDPDARYDRVLRRGRGLRSRRRAFTLGGAAAVVALALAGIAVATGGGSSSHRVVTLGSPSTTASPATATGSSTTGSTPGGSLPTLTTIAGPTPPTVAAPQGRPVSTTNPSRTPTTATATTVGHPATTAPPTTSAFPACPAGGLAYRTATDSSSYTPGDPVAVSLVITNVTGQTCDGPAPSGIGATAVLSHDGATVANIAGPAIACALRCAPPVLTPGASTRFSAGEWFSTGAAAGTYQVVASRLGIAGAAATFTIG